MNEKEELLCPWCQTLIRWDPEIGPEKECPHCFNELGGYRSINVKLGSAEEDEDYDLDELDDDGIAFPDDSLNLEDLEDFRQDEYGDAVQRIVDEQDEAPECPTCRDFMLFAGRREVSAAEFAPHVPASLGKPLLHGPFAMDLYLCPHCFRTDSLLSAADRLTLTKLLRGEE